MHNNSDDGVEFFGGNVNVKHVVLTGNGDDSMDWTDGWQGNAQFVIVRHASDAGDRAIEADNRGGTTGNREALPRSFPTVSNFTFIGTAATDTGIVVRAGTAGRFRNGVITGFLGDAGIDIDEDSTTAQATLGNLTFDSIYVVDNKDNLETDGDSGDAALTAAFAAGTNNVDGDAQVPAQDSTLTGFTPGANEHAVTSTDPTTLDSFFDAAPYVGAVKDANDTWYEGWTLLVDQ